MASYWIFTFQEYSSFCSSTESLFKRLKEDKKWYIGARTANKTNIKKGDKLVFYQAGKDGKIFVADAILETTVRKAQLNDMFDFVLISKLNFWNKPLPLIEVWNKLSFVNVKYKPGQYYFQAAIRRITEKDYLMLIARSRSRATLEKEA